jgi:hypothetical protein
VRPSGQRRWPGPAGLAPSGDHAGHAPLAQDLPARLPVVAGVQVHRGPLRQRANHVDGVQGGGQQPIVAAVGWGRHRRQRDPTRPDGDRALQPPACDAPPGCARQSGAAGRLGDAAVYRQVLQVQAEHAAIGGQHHQAYLLGQAEGDPLVAAAAQGGGRADGVGDPAVATAEHRDLDELVEHDPVGNAGPVAAERMGVLADGTSAATWTHRGSRTDDGRAGTRPPCDRRV